VLHGRSVLTAPTPKHDAWLDANLSEKVLLCFIFTFPSFIPECFDMNFFLHMLIVCVFLSRKAHQV
jgi:hypothetical protein